MRWARVAATVGAVLICAAFALGTEIQPSVRIGDESTTCGAAIPAGWLMSGSPSSAETGGATPEEPRLSAACEGRTTQVRWALGSLLALGGVMVLVGWTALCERDLRPASSTDAVVEEEHAARDEQPQDAE